MSQTLSAPKFAKIDVSGSGANEIVPAASGKKLRVLAWDVMAEGPVNVKWQSHTTPTNLTGLYYLSANGGIARSAPQGLFETVAGEALDLNLSDAVAVGGCVTYVEVLEV